MGETTHQMQNNMKSLHFLSPGRVI